jgi:hypothetical protein
VEATRAWACSIPSNWSAAHVHQTQTKVNISGADWWWGERVVVGADTYSQTPETASGMALDSRECRHNLEKEAKSVLSKNPQLPQGCDKGESEDSASVIG